MAIACGFPRETAPGVAGRSPGATGDRPTCQRVRGALSAVLCGRERKCVRPSARIKSLIK